MCFPLLNNMIVINKTVYVLIPLTPQIEDVEAREQIPVVAKSDLLLFDWSIFTK